MTASPGPIVVASLERLAERDLDLTPHVYERLFAERPEFEALFVLGPDAKGHMLDEVLRLILDFADTGAYARHLLAAERINHEALGVAAGDFLSFLDAVAATVAELSGAAWSEGDAAAWRELIAALKAETGP
jgi:hemoglobin-like flavoprotein